MPKLYIFGIGGTGSRVIKSLTMLFASGITLPNNFSTVVPIIIDPDTANGDLNKTKDILTKYQKIRSEVNIPNDFFTQELRTISNIANNSNIIDSANFQFNLDGVQNQTFSQYIGYGNLSNDAINNQDDQAFIDLLYSQQNLNSSLNVGFKGNPNMGSIVLNQFTNSKEFNTFAQTFVPGDAIFIISSIFGGTGAAGFPLLLKSLRNNDVLPNAININNAPIGGLTLLPYFTLNKSDEVDSDTFLEKSKIALDYYNRTIISQNQINAIHFIGDNTNNNIQQYSVGGEEQTNQAHFFELAASLSIIDFCNNIGNYTNNQGIAVNPTVVKEYGIDHQTPILSFSNLNQRDRNLLEKPLSKYYSFVEYINNENGLKKAVMYSRWTKSNIKIVKKTKQSPCDSKYFNSADFKNDILGFNLYFKDWITELSSKSPSFNPFNEKVDYRLFKKIDKNNSLLIDSFNKRNTTNQKHTTFINMLAKSISNSIDLLSIRTTDTNNINKVYRIHQGNAGSGWFTTNIINQAQLSTINTDGKGIASSIPSPFARIDLVKSAFEWINFQISQIVADNNNNNKQRDIIQIINGNSAQNKLISEAFDIGEIFFKYPSQKDRFNIIAWNPNQRFAANIAGNNKKNSLLFQTLDIFWNQDQPKDGVTTLYNFEKTNNLFLIVNSLTGKVVGGTSSATLFFAAPDALDNIGKPQNNNAILGDTPIALSNRDASYIQYIYALAAQPQFAVDYPDISQYLNNIQNYILDNGMLALINNANINNYAQPTVTNNPDFLLEIIGYNLGVEKSIFQDKIIKLPYNIDNNSYHTIGAPEYLLPITEQFLKSFTTAGIVNCQLKKLPSGCVDIQLVVQNSNGDSVTHKKTYLLNDVIDLSIHLAIVPFLETNIFNLDYTVGIIDTSLDVNNQIDLEFFNRNGNPAQITNRSIRRQKREKGDFSSVYFKTNSVEAIKVKFGQSEGFIIPNLPNKNGANQISFAIDFGTTNSHIEYKTSNGNIVPFDQQMAETNMPIWRSLLDRNDKVAPNVLANDKGFDEEILPLLLNNNVEKTFPFRTAIAYNKGTNFNTPLEYLLHTNNYLFYEKRSNITYDIKSDLKWSNYNDNSFTMLANSYIEGLLHMVLYKTLLLNGNPFNVNITWFYPVSMSEFEQGVFRTAWQNSYQKVFQTNNTNNLNAVPESIAPYLFYRGTNFAGASLSIDIGGGSSDIAFFKNADNNPSFISSVKFAGNVVFGDGFSNSSFAGSAENNGFVNSFKDEALTTLESDPEKRKSVLLDILNNRKSSADFSSFLFSLENDENISFNYSNKIRSHKNLKLPILIFHSAIIYYASTLLSLRDDSTPSNILYSGTASKSLSILDTSDGYTNLSKLFKHIISGVTGKDCQSLKIALDSQPKELTCKGALRGDINANLINAPTVYWLGGKGDPTWETIKTSNDNLQQTPKYKDLADNPQIKEYIKESIEHFYKIMDSYIENINLEKSFGTDLNAYKTFKKMRSNNVENFIDFGVKAFYHSEDNHIEETVFFYPLIGVLHQLAIDLSQDYDEE